MSGAPDVTSLYEVCEPHLDLAAIAEGDKWVVIDIKQHGLTEEAVMPKLADQDDIQRALFAERDEFGTDAGKFAPEEWKVGFGALECGDVVVVVGTGAPGEFDLIAIWEEKDDLPDFEASAAGDRFFGPGNEIERITSAGAKDNQAYLAYVEEGRASDPVWGTGRDGAKTIVRVDHPWRRVNEGVLISLRRDWGVQTYKITTRGAFARHVAAHARKAFHVPSEKSAKLAKKGVPLDQRRESLLRYALPPASAAGVWGAVGFPAVFIHCLGNVKWVLPSKRSKKPRLQVPKALRGIPGLVNTDGWGTKALETACRIFWGSIQGDVGAAAVEAGTLDPADVPEEEVSEAPEGPAEPEPAPAAPACAHQWKAANFNCTSYRCARCGAERGADHAHQWEEQNSPRSAQHGDHKEKCSACGEVRVYDSS